MPHVNGTGARPPEVFTFETSGYSVQYRRIPLQLYLDFEMGWRGKHTPPPVPRPMVDIGGEQRAVTNPSDPDYQISLIQYERDARNASYHFLWKRSLVLTEQDRNDVITLRTEMRESDGIS